MDLRPATRRDDSLLHRLETLCFEDPWDIESLRTHLSAPTQWTRLGQHQGESVTYSLWRVVMDEAELLRIGVLPSHRGQRLGASHLLLCLGSLRAEGVNDAYLEVRRSNRAALALYQTTGWVRVGERLRYYSDGEDALLYSLNL